MTIRIQKPGILTTVQDAGRHGFRALGINPNSPMDRTAARVINILLGNAETDAVLEMHFPAAEIVFEADTIFALGGGDFSPHLDGRPIDNWRPYFAKKTSSLTFAEKKFGSRVYLAVRGGFNINKWLASASTNLAANIGGHEGRKLQKGDRIDVNSPLEVISDISILKFKTVSSTMLPSYSAFPTVRMIPGREFETLSAESRKAATGQPFTITKDSDRMGFRLVGERLQLSAKLEVVSSAVDFGTVQLLPDGQLIVLMADHQTSGGYPRIGHIISRDLPLMAQLGPRDMVRFELVNIETAEKLALEYEKDLNFLRVGCRFGVFGR